MRALFDALFEKCPGLQEYIRVVGTDGEKSLVNVTCHSLKDFIRLLCSVHSKEKVKTRLKNANDQKLRQKVYNNIFESGNTNKGLVYSKTTAEFDKKVRNFKIVMGSECCIKSCGI